MSVFERYLSLRVGACMAFGILLGKVVPALVEMMRTNSPGASPTRALTPLLDRP